MHTPIWGVRDIGLPTSGRKDQILRAMPPVSGDPAADDAALLAALRQGDPNAIATLWRRHAPLVRGVARRLLGPDEDVEDVLQEIFIQCLRLLPGVRDPQALRMYLIRLTTNAVRGELRFRRVRRWVVPRAQLPEVADPRTNLEAHQALRRLYALLDRLPVAERTTFVLRFIEDMDLTEVAQAQGVSLATAKRHIAKVGDKVFGWVRQDGALLEFLEQSGVALRPRAGSAPEVEGHDV